MNTNLVAALAKVLVSEGGYSNNPKDPGGATMRGITQRVYDAYREAHGLPHAQVKFIAMGDVMAIYRTQYWDTVKADSLPTGIDYLVFDEAVNSGPVEAAKDLQRCVGAGADGHIGILTLSAVGTHKDFNALADALCDRRLTFLHKLKRWAVFSKGWNARVNTARANAHSMIAKAAVTVAAVANDNQPAAGPQVVRSLVA